MSRAFVKETEALDELPERLISEHRNLVTAEGLALIEINIKRLKEELVAAHDAGDRNAIARTSRDLRYWNQRFATAELQVPAADTSVAAFGGTVTVERNDGRIQQFRIVGEDEANPGHGTISYVSPLAQALLGKSVGDIVTAGAGEAEIIKIE